MNDGDAQEKEKEEVEGAGGGGERGIGPNYTSLIYYNNFKGQLFTKKDPKSLSR
jgi:hypothetical protein